MIPGTRLARAPDAPPLSFDPERFHARRSEIAHDLAELARRIAPRTGRRSGIAVAVSADRGGRIVGSTEIINGRRIVVQKRRSFAA
jgi:hypothetical protein